LGTIIFKEPGMEFLIEELSVCNTVTNAGATPRRQTEQTGASTTKLDASQIRAND
jgi:hypothetical protein